MAIQGNTGRQSRVSRQRHKDKKITIYTYSVIEDEDGYETAAYVPIHPGKLWAYVRQQSQSEYLAAMAVKVAEEMLFVVNWRSDLANGNVNGLYIEYKGAWYDIQRIDTFEGYKDDLQIYAKLTAKPAGV
jgi:SPP1 family predicted phage head-tail adaptor